MRCLSDYETDNSLKENFETEIKSGPQDRETVTSRSLNGTLKVLPTPRFFFFSVSTFDPWMCKFSFAKLDHVAFSINALHRSLSQLQYSVPSGCPLSSTLKVTEAKVTGLGKRHIAASSWQASGLFCSMPHNRCSMAVLYVIASATLF